MNDREHAPTNADIARFQYLLPMLESAIVEMRDFAKKKPDAIVSATKIKILNRLLVDLKDVIKGEASAAYLEPLSEEGLPQNSDAVLILGQYRAAMESFENRNKRTIDYRTTWLTQEWFEARDKDDEEVEYDDGDENDEVEESDEADEDEDSSP